MRTGYWFGICGSIAAIALFACSSSDTSGGNFAPKDGGTGGTGGSVVGKGGSSNGGSSNGGSSNGGSSNGGSSNGGSSNGGSSAGGSGGAPIGTCASGETCTDVSNGAKTDYACVTADPSTMPTCTDGPFGKGCPTDQMCYQGQTETVCAGKDGNPPTTAKDCTAPTDCAANEGCFGSGTTGKCLQKGCTVPTCDSTKTALFSQDTTTGMVNLCICATPCKP